MGQNLKDLSFFIKLNLMLNMAIFMFLSVYYMFMSRFYLDLSDQNKVSDTSVYYMNSKHLSEFYLVWFFLGMFIVTISFLCLVGINYKMLSWLLFSMMTPYIILSLLSIYLQGQFPKLSFEHDKNIEAPIILYRFNRVQLQKYLDLFGLYEPNMTDTQTSVALAKIVMGKAIVEGVFLVVMTIKELYYVWQSSKLGYFFLKIK